MSIFCSILQVATLFMIQLHYNWKEVEASSISTSPNTVIRLGAIYSELIWSELLKASLNI